MTLVTDLWQEGETLHPSGIALIAGDERVSYLDFARRTRELSRVLAEDHAVGPGSIVGLLSPNGIEFVVGYFAVIAAGGTVQPLDARLGGVEVRELLRDSGAERVLVHDSHRAMIAGLAPDPTAPEPGLAIATPPEAGRGRAERSGVPPWNHRYPDPEAIAELLYTSGTTGLRKGVMRSHRAVRAAARNARVGFGYREGDRIAIAMPLSHSSALVSQLHPILEGRGTAVLLESFDPDRLLRELGTHRVTCFRGVPTMFRVLLTRPGFNGGALPALRLLMNSSAPIDPATFATLRDRFPGVEVVDSYGLTEASTCTILSDDRAGEEPASVGVPIEGVELRVVDERGEPVPPGVEGEIQVRGPHLFSGYLDRPEATSSVSAPGGWLRTGDAGHLGDRGHLHLHGRLDALINCGGRKFAGEEVERCILELPSVGECAVVGVPHRMLGQVARAFVVFVPGVEPDVKAVKGHCARRLPSHMVPFTIEGVESLPRTSLGKVIHRNLGTAVPEPDPSG